MAKGLSVFTSFVQLTAADLSLQSVLRKRCHIFLLLVVCFSGSKLWLATNLTMSFVQAFVVGYTFSTLNNIFVYF